MPQPAVIQAARKSPSDVKLNLQKATRAATPTRSQIAHWARAALPADAAAVELTVRLVDEDESAALNHQWRGKQGATNVLSFSFGASPGIKADFLGDLVICAPLVPREAAEQNRPVQAHWAHLVVHGIMHLRGYDHETDPEARVMEAHEARIMEQLGFDNPYS